MLPHRIDWNTPHEPEAITEATQEQIQVFLNKTADCEDADFWTAYQELSDNLSLSQFESASIHLGLA
jgi:hypothetical protein